jgi:hypothetical protein
MNTTIIRDLTKRAGSWNNNVRQFYVTQYPTNQNMLIFLPGTGQRLCPRKENCISTPGTSQLFDDQRIHWPRRLLWL